jgi:hypothetical protein
VPTTTSPAVPNATPTTLHRPCSNGSQPYPAATLEPPANCGKQVLDSPATDMLWPPNPGAVALPVDPPYSVRAPAPQPYGAECCLPPAATRPYISVDALLPCATGPTAPADATPTALQSPNTGRIIASPHALSECAWFFDHRSTVQSSSPSIHESEEQNGDQSGQDAPALQRTIPPEGGHLVRSIPSNFILPLSWLPFPSAASSSTLASPQVATPGNFHHLSSP